jgi:hypothetical protein
VTEWACKACAYAHARFDSAVTHHPPADFAIADEIRKWPSNSRIWYIGSAMRRPRIDSGSIPLVRAKIATSRIAQLAVQEANPVKASV